MIYRTLFFIGLSILTSCSIKGLTNDYKKLSEEDKSNIVQLQNFKDLGLTKIYKINASQLNEEIATHHKTMVYLFTNGCTSKMCKPMLVYENYAKSNGYDLFLVMNGYANIDKTLNQPRQSPLFAVDGPYYKTIYRSDYVNYFMNEISGLPTHQKRDFTGDIFFFSDGKLDKILMELPH